MRTVTDGRDIDLKFAELIGEAAGQAIRVPEEHTKALAGVWENLPLPDPQDPTYYDRPLIKEPVWKPYIPLYYFIGGAAGASLALGAAAQLHGSRDLDRLIRRCHWIGIIGSSIGGGLLILDLGRPERFLFMLRVFRPTSPMNMGAWILAIAPTAAVTAGLFLRRSGPLALLGEVAGYSSGVFGLGLATYTGVLLANSAVPVWQASRKTLPVLFGASGVAAAASFFDLLYEDPQGARITRAYGIIGRTAELAAAYVMERQAAEVPRVARPLRNGLSGALWRTATVLTAASLVTLLIPGQSRKKRLIAGVLGCAGSLAMRFAVERAGMASARDPKASFHQQRAAIPPSEGF
jgi:formate-dependent nitrite reductase membrane component NrfD